MQAQSTLVTRGAAEPRGSERLADSAGRSDWPKAQVPLALGIYSSALSSLSRSLGLDFGAHNSKLGVCIESIRGLEVDRIQFNPPNGERELYSAYECPSLAAFDRDGQVVVGNAALEQDITFHLNVMLLYCAGIREERKLSGLPGKCADKLLLAIAEDRFSESQMEKAIKEHFELLRDAARYYSENAQVVFNLITVTYPNFLCSDDAKGDLDKYTTYLMKLVKKVFTTISLSQGSDDGIQYFAISEGQAALIYMCEKFEDPAHETQRRTRNYGRSRPVRPNILLADWEGISLNLRVHNVYYDHQGRLDKVQTSATSPVNGWLTVMTGRSHVSKSGIRKFFEGYLPNLSRRFRDGDIDAYTRDFELRQHQGSFDSRLHHAGGMRLMLTIQPVAPNGRDPLLGKPTLLVAPQEVLHILGKLNPFDWALEVLSKVLRAQLEAGRDFEVLFLGGSFSNFWLRREVQNLVAKFVTKATARGIGVTDRYLFNNEHYTYMSAVSVGAALAPMNMAMRADLLDGAAIGV